MKTLDQKDIIGITALLVHAAKIDEQYSDHEKILIKDFIKSYLKNDDNDEILKKAEEIECNSNQLISFTNLIKKNTTEVKSDIIEHLWKIIISDKTIDQNESNLYAWPEGSRSVGHRYVGWGISFRLHPAATSTRCCAASCLRCCCGFSWC